MRKISFTLLSLLALTLVLIVSTSCGGNSSPGTSSANTLSEKPTKKEKSGEELYKMNCASCHGSKGQGIVGPNLTDNYWIHENTLEGIINITTNGAPAQGMIAYKSLLSTEEIERVSEYVWTLKGTNVPDGREPEGELKE